MEWTDLLAQYLPIIARLVLIIFSTLGVVYMSGRLLFPKMKDRGKNIVAAISLLLIGFLTTYVYNYSLTGVPIDDWQLLSRYLLDSLMYTFGGAVFYVVIGWRFYSRMDAFLDRKVAKDDKRKQ